MNHQVTRRLTAIACSTVLVLAACGGGDDGGGSASAGADTEIGKALAADMLATDEGSPVQTEEEARCWSGVIVDGVGEDRLKELGVSAEAVGDIEDLDLTDGEIDIIVDGLFDCADVRSAFAAEFVSDFGEEGAQCVADELDQDLISTMMKSTFAGDNAEPPEEFMQAFLDIAAKCDLPLG